MAKLIVSLLAQGDETAIVRDLAEKAGTRVAAKYVLAFDRVYTRLVDHPESGSPRPSLGPLVRIAVAAPYTILYEYDVQSDTATIFRIVHGRRQITGAMLQSDVDRAPER